jgi:hypothetical protein
MLVSNFVFVLFVARLSISSMWEITSDDEDLLWRQFLCLHYLSDSELDSLHLLYVLVFDFVNKV